VNGEGYIENAGVKRNDISELNQGKIEKINAIVLHRTNSSTKESALSSFKSGIGTHFLIDKNGDIYQTAGLSTYVYQIGFIQARCENDKACTSMDKKY
jgi:N-acetyl-anhydromuramyl-L-alanine amidase AmpD